MCDGPGRKDYTTTCEGPHERLVLGRSPRGGSRVRLGLELEPASNAYHSPSVVHDVRLEAVLQFLECIRSEDSI